MIQFKVLQFCEAIFCLYYYILFIIFSDTILMGQCLGSCVSCFCCQCNWAIFPAPLSMFGWNFEQINHQKEGQPPAQIKLLFFNNSHAQKVPYIEMSNQKSKNSKRCLIYFHGNAQDIFLSIQFLIPIFKNIQTTIFVLQYPTYSCYQTNRFFFISNRIKQNSQQFHKYLISHHNFSKQSINVMGRSIGTGPATYLANRMKTPHLILISPFDQISSVAQSHVGCLGKLLKNHFNNEEQIRQYNGKLLVIHGKMDQVIRFQHGRRLVQIYEHGSVSKEQKNKKAVFIQSVYMSHNNFDMHEDIVIPIEQFYYK